MFFADDGLFRFGNAPTVKGRSEISASVSQFFESIKALRHRVLDTWRSGDVEISEVEVTYPRHDDKMPLDVSRLFDTVDRQDAAGFGMFFTEDGLFRFGNAPTVKGRSEISASVSQFLESIKALRHRVLDTWRSGDVEICEVEVTYTRHDDSTVDLMAAYLFRMQGDRIADYRIYMDISPLARGELEPLST